MKNNIYVHEIKLPEKDAFSKKFNECSELFQKWRDEKDEKIKEEYWKGFIFESYRLETGSFY